MTHSHALSHTSATTALPTDIASCAPALQEALRAAQATFISRHQGSGQNAAKYIRDVVSMGTRIEQGKTTPPPPAQLTALKNDVLSEYCDDLETATTLLRNNVAQALKDHHPHITMDAAYIDHMSKTLIQNYRENSAIDKEHTPTLAAQMAHWDAPDALIDTLIIQAQTEVNAGATLKPWAERMQNTAQPSHGGRSF